MKISIEDTAKGPATIVNLNRGDPNECEVQGGKARKGSAILLCFPESDYDLSLPRK